MSYISMSMTYVNLLHQLIKLQCHTNVQHIGLKSMMNMKKRSLLCCGFVLLSPRGCSIMLFRHYWSAKKDTWVPYRPFEDLRTIIGPNGLFSRCLIDINGLVIKWRWVRHDVYVVKGYLLFVDIIPKNL